MGRTWVSLRPNKCTHSPAGACADRGNCPWQQSRMLCCLSNPPTYAPDFKSCTACTVTLCIGTHLRAGHGVPFLGLVGRWGECPRWGELTCNLAGEDNVPLSRSVPSLGDLQEEDVESSSLFLREGPPTPEEVPGGERLTGGALGWRGEGVTVGGGMLALHHCCPPHGRLADPPAPTHSARTIKHNYIPCTN